MKLMRIRGTFFRTHRKLVMTLERRPGRIVLVEDGRIAWGTRSLHRTNSGRRINKLHRLFWQR